MSRAESLAAATDYLFRAVFALDGAARVLDGAGVLGAADQARGLHAEVRCCIPRSGVRPMPPIRPSALSFMTLRGIGLGISPSK